MKPGSVVIYDEAGTQMSSQRSLNSDVIEQQDILIINGWLNLVHILNVPKPRSIHFYPREERCKLMLWHHKEYDRTNNIRKFHVYGYDRIRYVSMMQENAWHKAFTHTGILIKKFPPTFHVELPDLNQYIRPEILKDYKSVKIMYSIAKAQGGLNATNGATKDNVIAIAKEIIDSGKIISIPQIRSKYELGETKARQVRAEIKLMQVSKPFTRELPII
jgi:hypothetical protein